MAASKLVRFSKSSVVEMGGTCYELNLNPHAIYTNQTVSLIDFGGFATADVAFTVFGYPLHNFEKAFGCTFMLSPSHKNQAFEYQYRGNMMNFDLRDAKTGNRLPLADNAHVTLQFHDKALVQPRQATPSARSVACPPGSAAACHPLGKGGNAAITEATATTTTTRLAVVGEEKKKAVKKKRTVTAATKRSIAGRQFNQCANGPDQKYPGLEAYPCPLWAKTGPTRGNFDESGFEVDHVKEYCLTQNDDVSNLRALCKMCHSVKTKRFLRGVGNNKKKKPPAKAVCKAKAKQ
jgi:5-methylcytosine-specific restriction endonuclease McrA